MPISGEPVKRSPNTDIPSPIFASKRRFPAALSLAARSRQGLAPERRIHAARRRPADGLAQPHRQAAVR